ncbi:helix-turn-helix transcriptional regulator [Otariodibacter sp.]|uniref:helix-turn-helix domain-containing protein n=1 Tax=Otariodibacter sp. TaxID=3030919 RepID=UPI002623ACD1|nr:helix-turn-helix transcriptional regulator [Otariodibacter sp.]
MAQLAPEIVDKLVGKRIQMKRKEYGYTTETLSELLNISQQQLSRYERGQNKINSAHLVSIATYLKTPIGWFFMDCVSPEGFEVKEIDQYWYNLSDKQKQAFVAFLTSIQQ